MSAKTLFQAKDFCSWSLSASVSQKPLSVPSKNSSFKLDVLKINHWLALRCFLNCSRLDFCRLPGTYTSWMHSTHTATPQTATQLSQDVWIKSTSVAWDRSVVAARGGTVKKKHPTSLIPPLSQHLWPAVKRAAFFFPFHRCCVAACKLKKTPLISEISPGGTCQKIIHSFLRLSPPPLQAAEWHEPTDLLRQWQRQRQGQRCRRQQDGDQSGHASVPHGTKHHSYL